MTDSKFKKLIKELGLKMFYRYEFGLLPLKMRIFCFEDQRFAVEDFVADYLPLYVWAEIITECHDYRAYQPPKSTITDHLKDCFGFLC